MLLTAREDFFDSETESYEYTVSWSDSVSETDEKLLELISANDESALAKLHARYSLVVFNFVLTRTSDPALAEEISADVWLGCWRSASAYRKDSRVLTWLLGIAKRQIHTHTRGKRILQVPLEEIDYSLADSEADPAQLVVSAAQTHQILAALRSLPPDLSEVVRLAWIYELPYSEIAKLADIPVGTVKSRISRARRLLQEKLRSKYG